MHVTLPLFGDFSQRQSLTLPPLGGSVFIGVLLGDFDSTLYYGVQFLCSTWYIVLSTTVHV